MADKTDFKIIPQGDELSQMERDLRFHPVETSDPQTLSVDDLARAHVLLHQVDDTPGYHVYAHRSFADYVYAWLHDAATEYGVAPTPR